LALGDRLVDSYESLDKATVLSERIVESVGNVDVAQIRLDRLVGRNHVQVHHDAVHEVDGAVNETGVPDLGLPHFNCDTWDVVLDERRLNGARLAGVDLQRVGLQQLRQP
jgi:hypothetical protein